MPIANGDSMEGSGAILTDGEVLSYKNATAELKNYAQRDGISMESLMDTEKRGGLVYNDFLVLPGKIGQSPVSQ